MKYALCTLAASAIIVLQGCSKEAPPESQAPTLSDISDAKKIKEAAQEKIISTAVVADKSVPLEKYSEMSSGKQVMFAYLAKDTMPLNYEKIAEIISRDYQIQHDEFKKRDLLNSLRPAIDSEVAKARNNGYYHITINDQIENYNFDDKSFPHTGFDETSFRYFYDVANYKLKFTNTAQFRRIKVTDETLAREIESLRSKGFDHLKTKVYFFVYGTELGSENALAEITKVKIQDKSGKTLVEI